MENFNTPDWEQNNVGDKASEEFAKVGNGKSLKKSGKPSSKGKYASAKSPIRNIASNSNNIKKKVVKSLSKGIAHAKQMSPTKKGKILESLKASPQPPKKRKSGITSVKIESPKKQAKSGKLQKTPAKSPKIQASLNNREKSTSGKVQRQVNNSPPTTGNKRNSSPGKSSHSPEKKTKVELMANGVGSPRSPKYKKGKVLLSASQASARKSNPSIQAPTNHKKSPKAQVSNIAGASKKSPRVILQRISLKDIHKITQKSNSLANNAAGSVSPNKKLQIPAKVQNLKIKSKKSPTKHNSKLKIKISGLFNNSKKLAGTITLGKTLSPKVKGTKAAKIPVNSKLKTKVVTPTSSKTSTSSKKPNQTPHMTQKNRAKLNKNLSASMPKKTETLHKKMSEKLKAARFRYINEQLYTIESSDAVRFFQEDPDSFHAYHAGYRQQVEKWPMNPLTKIINGIRKMPDNLVVADFGCGDAELAKSVNKLVHSFDLVSNDPNVTACDMANVPLANNSVDVAVFCLSLMGTNLQDYLLEANRILKVGGILKIAEVESRFDNVDTFITGVECFGFNNILKDFNYNIFYFMDFQKARDIKNNKNLPTMSLHPCIYKKR